MLGDVVAFSAALALMLFVRYGADFGGHLGYQHIAPFSIIFLLSVLVFFIVGLYEKRTTWVEREVPRRLLQAQIINAILAIALFYFSNQFAIAPRINLFIYLLFSAALVLLWRQGVAPYLRIILRFSNEGRHAVLVATGVEADELWHEVNSGRYGFTFTARVDSGEPDLLAKVQYAVAETNASIVVIDLEHPAIKQAAGLHRLLFHGVTFTDAHSLYESLFDRIPVSLINEQWLLEHVSFARKPLYDNVRRIADVVLAGIAAICSLVVYPFIWAAIKLDDGGKLFISQERIGKGGKVVRIHKFRTMKTDDAGDEAAKKQNGPTRIGPWLRVTRIDELPQLWDVVRGNISLIGPRPELPAYVTLYEKEIPFYGIRHLMSPGLSGWAQIYHRDPPKTDASVDKTKAKLSYDLYYIKNRSLWLDISIVLRTLQILMLRNGR